MQRYAFPPGADPYLIVDPRHNNHGAADAPNISANEGEWSRTGEDEITGSTFNGDYRVFFVARFDKPIVGVGDHWLLGRNRLLCGSALDTGAFIALMGAERAAMACIDPPYNVPIDGHASGLGAIHHRPFAMASGEMSRVEFTGFLAQACHNLAAFSAGGSLHFICMDWRHLGELLAASNSDA